MRKNSSLCHGMKTEDLKRCSWTDPGRCQPPAAAVAGDPTALVERKQPAQTGPLLLRKQISTMQVFSFSPLCMHPISQTALQRQKLLFELVEHYDSLYIYIDSMWQYLTSVETICLIQMSSSLKTSWFKKTGWGESTVAVSKCWEKEEAQEKAAVMYEIKGKESYYKIDSK